MTCHPARHSAPEMFVHGRGQFPRRANALPLLAATQHRAQEHQQCVANRHCADHIDRVNKIFSKTSDRLKAWVVKLCEHDDGLTKRRPKSKTNFEVTVKKVKTDQSINECKRQCSQQ